MRYLIDGYNLLHAMGALQGRVGPQGLEKARQRLLGLLHGAFRQNPSNVTVVFDAANSPPDVPDEQEYQGIHVRFAVHQEQADDLIESLIQHSSAPRQLAVVSDDHRLQQAARRRDCQALGCLDFLEELAHGYRKQRRPPASAPAEKQPLSQQEMQMWLSQFAYLDDEPEMKELFGPFDFSDPEME
jgi:uncharacterized protein